MDSHTYSLAELGVIFGMMCTSITGMAVAIITAWRTGARIERVGNNLGSHLGVIKDQVDVVEKNTNNKLTEQDNQIKELLSELKHLREQLADQEKSRAVLAAEARSAPPQTGEAPPRRE